MFQRRITIIRSLNIIAVFLELQSIYGMLIKECSVAQIMRHHDWRIQRAEVQSGDWNVVVTFLWLNDSGTFVLLIRTCNISLADCGKYMVRQTNPPFQGRNNVALVIGFPKQLRQHFDGLTPWQEIIEGYTGHTGHLDVIDKTHKFVHQPLGKVSILKKFKSRNQWRIVRYRMRRESEPWDSIQPSVASTQVSHSEARW